MKKSIALVVLLFGCMPVAEEVKERPDTPDPDPAPEAPCEPEDVSLTAGASLVADAGNAFAMDMYDEVWTAAPDNGNLLFSPFSVSSALGMTLVGADGETAAQMRDIFYVENDEAAHHEGYSDLRQAVFAKGANCDTNLNLVNRLFGMEGYPWLEPFLETTASDYGAPMEEVDFLGDSEGVRVHINDWVADQTEERILDLLPPGSIQPITRLVLANAIYFQGDWAHAFDPQNTVDSSFTRPDGSSVTTPMMFETVHARTAFAQGVNALELEYQGSLQSMVVMMPEDPQSDEAPTSAFDLELVDELESAFVDAGEVAVGLPRFSFAQETDLKGVLMSMGMVDAFDSGRADLTRMAEPLDTDEVLYLGGAYHKAFVAVDETGTEAAAATAVVVDSYTSEGPEFVANRPFEFYIRDNLSGAILFMGRVADPTAE